MHKRQLVLIPAVALGAVLMAGMSGCTLYGAGNSGDFLHYHSASGYSPLSGANGCGYLSFSRCSDLGAYLHGYNHLHSGWEDGFHGHGGSSHDNPWLSPAFGFNTYGRHGSHAHDALFAPPVFSNWRMDHATWGHWASTAVWDERSAGHGPSTQGTSHRDIPGHVSSSHLQVAPHSNQILPATSRHRFESGWHAGSHR